MSRIYQFLLLIAVVFLPFPLFAVTGECAYWDADFEEPTMNIGGEAIAGAFAIVNMAVPADYEGELDLDDPNYIYYYPKGGGPQMKVKRQPLSFSLPYKLWDFDENSIYDSIQFALLTELLCLPDSVQHPLVDLTALREAMQENESMVEDLVSQVLDSYDQLATIEPILLNLSNGMKSKWTAAGIPNPNLPIDDPNIFLSKEISGPFVSLTWMGLANSFASMHISVEDIILYWSVGQSVLNNRATTQLLAAVFGLLTPDSWNQMMSMSIFTSIELTLRLGEFDWDYLFDKFFLDSTMAEAFAEAVTEMDLTPDLMPTEESAGSFGWEDLMNSYTGEGEFIDDTLENTYCGEKARVVQAIHGSVSFDVCQNDALFFEDLAFKSITPYADITAPYPDFEYSFAAVETGEDCSNALASVVIDAEEPGPYTIVLLGTETEPEIFVVNDVIAAPKNGMAKLRFVNVNTDERVLNVMAGGAVDALFSEVAYKGVSTAIEILPGAYSFDFVDADKGNKALPPVDMVLHSGSVYTLFALGGSDSLEMEVITDILAPSLVSIDEPSRVSYFVGESLTLTAELDSSANPVAYAWYRNQDLLPEMTGDTLAISDLDVSDSGRYTVVVTASLDEDKGITQLSDTSPLIQVFDPQFDVTGVGNIKFGEAIHLVAAVDGSDPVALTSSGVSWYKDSLLVGSGDEFTVPYAALSDAGVYEAAEEIAIAGHPDASVTLSAQHMVTVDGPQVNITGRDRIKPEESINLLANLSNLGTTPLVNSYVWTRDNDGNTEVLSTNPQMIINHATIDDSSLYKVLVASAVAADPGITAYSSATRYVLVTDQQIPVGSLAGLILLGALGALGGLAVKKQK